MVINGIKTKQAVINVAVITAIVFVLSSIGLWMSFQPDISFSSLRLTIFRVVCIAAPVAMFMFLRKQLIQYRNAKEALQLEVKDAALYVAGEKVINVLSGKINVTLNGFLTGSKRFAISFRHDNNVPLRDPIRHYSFDHHLEDFANALPKDFKVKRQTFFGL